MKRLRKFRSWRFLQEARHKQHWRAALVGLGAGGMAVVFQRALAAAEGGRIALLDYLHKAAPSWGWIILPIIAGVVGAFAGWLTNRFAPEAAGSGIPHVKGVLMHARTFSWKRILPVKFIGGVLSIGSGFSLGREGPTVQMGAAMGRALADLLHVPAKAAPRLMACGAGAGLAAAFHAPLAGFIFTIEELQRELSSLTYGMALIAAVVADIVTTSTSGQDNAFHAAGFHAAPLTTLPLFIIIGLLAGLVGTAFNRSLISMQRHFSKVVPLPVWARAGLIGSLAGLAAWWLPEATGSGHRVAEQILHGNFVTSEMIGFLCLLLAAKGVLTLLSYAAGVPGGIFAPMLVLGSVLGMLVGIASATLLPGLVSSPESFSVIGMAALFAAVVRAPLTGIVLVLEMTGDYKQLLPLLSASMVAYIVAERLHVKPIYDALLACDLEKTSLPAVAAPSEPILLEFVVQEDSSMDGAQIRALGLPEKCLLVTISREGRDLVPNGDTVLRAGDHITAVASGGNAALASATIHSLSKVL